MSSCDVAPLKVDSDSSSSWSWATLHQLLSTAADYGGHDVVIGCSWLYHVMEMMFLFCFSARPKVMD